MSSTPSLPFVIRDRVRWSDCDPLGIIYYGTYVRFFEVAEWEMFRSVGLTYEAMRVQKHVQLPRKAVAMEFHSPAQMDEEVEVGVGITRIGETSITMRFEVHRVGDHASDRAHRATGTITVVCVEKEGVVKKALPQFVKDALRPFVIPA